MKSSVFFGLLLASVIALVLSATFFSFAQLPDLFQFSTVVVPAVLTGILALGIGLLLPDQIYFTRAERLAEELQSATGIGGYDLQRVLDRADEARHYAKTLRAATTGMQPDIAEATNAAADDLNDLATRILRSPQRANTVITFISRAALVVEAVTKFVAFKSDISAKPEEVEIARAQVVRSLQNMSDEADDVHSRLARVKLMEIDVATDVADNLFGRGRKQ